MNKSTKGILAKKLASQLHKSNAIKREAGADERQVLLNPAISTVGSSLSVQSTESTRSRRMQHPAFAARSTLGTSALPLSKIQGAAGPVTMGQGQEDESKPFSETLFSSFRHFKEAQAGSSGKFYHQ